MEKELVPYELAKKMYLLGYNERNEYYYANGVLNEGITYNSDDKHRPYESVSAPLFQQAFRWFRQEHHLAGLISIGSQEYTYEIWDEKDGKSGKMISRFNPDGTYEESELACLEKLIEIVEQKGE